MHVNHQIIEDNRALYDSIGTVYPSIETVDVTKDTINGVTCYWFVPKNSKPKEIVIYIHGGGYAIGSIHSHQAMVSHYANGIGRTVLFVDYSLAPENQYPAGLNDVVGIYRWLADEFPNYQFYMMGDSAGGGLVIASVKAIEVQNLMTPKAIALISPWFNLETNNPSSDIRQHLDQILNKEMVRNFAFAYAGQDLSIADPSKLIFNQFPPVFVGVGTNEILFDDSINFFERIYTIQENAQLKIYSGQGHVFPQMDIFSPASQDLIANINNFFNQFQNV